jgi:hypothetical protein
LLLVGSIFIIKDYVQSQGSDENTDSPVNIPDAVGNFFETLVGCFMLVLGVYGFRSAFQKRREMYGLEIVDQEDASVEDGNDDDENSTTLNNAASLENATLPRENVSTGREDTGPTTQTELLHDDNPECSISYDTCSQNVLEVDSSSEHQGSTQTGQTRRAFCDWTRRLSTKTLAFFAGIVHGLAGPGGVLGVIPAVQLHNWKLATCYLGSFCVSSTLTMGVFACTYGTISTYLGRKTNLEFQIQCFSSALSILVGITWLVLLSLGKLDEVFP